MNLNELEKDLRDFRPANHEKINTEVLWDRVSPYIPQSKIKHRVLPFFVMLLSVALIALITKNDLTHNKEIQANKQDISEFGSNKTNPQEEDAIVHANVNDKQSIENNKNEIENKNNSIQNGQIRKEQNLISIPSRTINTEKQKIKDVGVNEVAKKQHSETTVNYPAVINPIKANAYNLNNDRDQDELKVNGERRNPISANESLKVTETSLEKHIEKLNNAVKYSNRGVDEKDKIFKAEKPNTNNVAGSKVTTSKVLESRERLNVFYLSNTLNLFEVENSEPSFVPKKISPYVYRDHPKMSIEIGGSYLSPNRKLTLMNPEFSSELESRELAEEVLEGWYASVGFRYNVTPQIGINVGMQYGSINERSSKSLSYTETLFLEDTIIGNLIRVDGSVDPIYGDLEIDRTIMKNVSRINSYTFLQMPIELIYTQPVNRLNLEFGLGIIQNISFKQSGFWHPDDRSEYDLSIDERGYLKSKLGLGLTGRLGIGYDLTPGIGVYGHARFIKHLSGVTSANYGIDQSYSLMGAEIGLRLHLFN